MTTLILRLMGEARGWIAGALVALITVAGVYLRGRADGKAKLRANADRAWREKTTDRQEIDDDVAKESDLARRARRAGIVHPDR